MADADPHAPPPLERYRLWGGPLDGQFKSASGATRMFYQSRMPVAQPLWPIELLPTGPVFNDTVTYMYERQWLNGAPSNIYFYRGIV